MVVCLPPGSVFRLGPRGHEDVHHLVLLLGRVVLASAADRDLGGHLVGRQRHDLAQVGVQPPRVGRRLLRRPHLGRPQAGERQRQRGQAQQQAVRGRGGGGGRHYQSVFKRLKASVTVRARKSWPHEAVNWTGPVELNEDLM